jgi:hypothetical protein
MDDADRRKPLGKYTTPRFRHGQIVTCEVRGEVRIVGLTDARIPWPIGQTIGGRARGLIIFKGLARAVCKESGTAAAMIQAGCGERSARHAESAWANAPWMEVETATTLAPPK